MFIEVTQIAPVLDVATKQPAKIASLEIGKSDKWETKEEKITLNVENITVVVRHQDPMLPGSNSIILYHMEERLFLKDTKDQIDAVLNTIDVLTGKPKFDYPSSK